MLLIDDLLMLPIKGFFALIRKIDEMARQELEDTPEKLKRELLDAQMLFETDQISEEEYNKREKEIMTRLTVLSKTKE